MAKNKSKITELQLIKELKKNGMKSDKAFCIDIAKKYGLATAHSVTCKVSAMRVKGMLEPKMVEKLLKEEAEEKEAIKKMMEIVEDAEIKESVIEKPIEDDPVEIEEAPEEIEKVEEIKEVKNEAPAVAKEKQAPINHTLGGTLDLKELIVAGEVFTFRISQTGVQIVQGCIDIISKASVKEEMKALMIWESEFND